MYSSGFCISCMRAGQKVRERLVLAFRSCLRWTERKILGYGGFGGAKRLAAMTPCSFLSFLGTKSWSGANSYNSCERRRSAGREGRGAEGDMEPRHKSASFTPSLSLSFASVYPSKLSVSQDSPGQSRNRSMTFAISCFCPVMEHF